MKTNNFAFALMLFLLFAVGCGGKPSVTGQVTFPDGTPMGVGMIHFESATAQAVSVIKADGTYTMTSAGSQGIPAGTYKVFFSGYGPQYDLQGFTPEGEPKSVMVSDVKCPIAEKYLSVTTSDLTCEVKGSMRHTIVVEPAK